MRTNTILTILTLLAYVLALPNAALAGKRYALVVGVKTYRPGQTLPELSYTENDANDLAAVLQAGGYDVTLMTQTVGRTAGLEVFSPLSDYIRDQLSAILDNPFLTEDDMVLVALAGHGVQYELVDDAGGKTPKFYFCPADADVVKLQTANDITDRNRLLDLGELYTALKNCKAGGKLLLVDACRNDPTKPGLARSLASATLPALPPPPGGTAAFFSCSAHQQAFEDQDLQHGVFFHHVIEALKGDADTSTASRPADQQITISELSEHVSASTYDFVRAKYQGAKQAPELKGEFRVSIPLITVARAAAPVRPNMPIPSSPVGSPTVPYRLGTQAGQTREITLPRSEKLVQVWIPKPEQPFTMGTPGAADNESLVQVTLTQGFWLGETEVTQGQWQAVMGTTPWTGKAYVKEGANYPATYVDWYDAVEFCNKLSASQQLTPCYRISNRQPATGSIDSATVEFLASGTGYRLPTEAQWEYACRGGTTGDYSFEGGESQLGDYAWWGGIVGDGNCKNEQYAHIVRQRKKNPWGLYDMHGNVWEWCQDGYGEKLPGGSDPPGDATSTYRVLRGGSWYNFARYTRSAGRLRFTPVNRVDNIGFRVCVSVRTP